MVRSIQAVVLAIYGINQSFKPANTTYSYGHARIEVICGLVNGVFLLSVSLMMGIEVHVLVAGCWQAGCARRTMVVLVVVLPRCGSRQEWRNCCCASPEIISQTTARVTICSH